MDKAGEGCGVDTQLSRQDRPKQLGQLHEARGGWVVTTTTPGTKH